MIRPLRLLDVEGLRSVNIKGSIFDPDYLRRLQRAKFLEKLSHQMTMPVMPDDEPFDYLVTQAIADYLATVAKTHLDGMIYPSVQGENWKMNVVLFHNASRVQLLDLPEGIKLEAQLDNWTEEELEIDYRVSELIPQESQSKKDKEYNLLDFSWEPAHRSNNFDARDDTLRLDIESLKVCHVNGVNYDTASFSVRRHRFKEGDF